MKSDRRDFLKIFGAAGAVVPVVSSTGKATADTVTDSSVKPLDFYASFRSNMIDLRKGRLYSMLRLTPRGGDSCEIASRHNFFHYALGQVIPSSLRGQVASPIATNLWVAAQLAPPHQFLVERAGMLFSPASACIDVARFCERYTLSIVIGQKSFFQRPLAECFSVDRTAVHTTTPLIGLADLKPLPLYLQSLQSFGVEANGEPFKLSAPLTMWAIFDGLEVRGVQ